jgi:hypothetical protein
VGAAATSHAHSGADITSGTVAFARLPVGTSSTSVAAGNDPRFADARTPTAHAASHASAGSDPITVAQSQVTGLTTSLAALTPLSTPVVTVSGTSYNCTNADNGKVLVCTSSSATAITVPTAVSVGWSITVRKAGTGIVTIDGGAGTTVQAPNGKRLTTVGETAVVDVMVTNTVNINGGVVV